MHCLNCFEYCLDCYNFIPENNISKILICSENKKAEHTEDEKVEAIMCTKKESKFLYYRIFVEKYSKLQGGY
jgi:hypothetical protein